MGLTTSSDLAGLYGLVPDKTSRAFGFGIPPPAGADSLDDRARRWLSERTDRLKSNTRFARALKAIIALQFTGLYPPDLALTLTFFACMAVTPKGSSRKPWEKIWALETGKTWKSLTEFPDRLRRMADEIERVNGSLWFSPAQYISAQTRMGELVRKRFEILPGMLRLYAAGLKLRNARLPVLKDQVYPPSKGTPMNYIVGVSCVVKVTTGRYRDREVADLLNAAAVALEKKDLEEKRSMARFDALTIAQARSRFFKRNRKT